MLFAASKPPRMETVRRLLLVPDEDGAVRSFAYALDGDASGKRTNIVNKSVFDNDRYHVFWKSACGFANLSRRRRLVDYGSRRWNARRSATNVIAFHNQQCVGCNFLTATPMLKDPVPCVRMNESTVCLLDTACVHII